MTEIRRIRGPPPSPHRQGHDAGGLGGELQAPGGGHRQPGDLADHGPDPAVPQTLLETGQETFLVPRLHIEDAPGIQPGLLEGRGEEVRTGDAP